MTPAEREGLRIAEQRPSKLEHVLMWGMVALVLLLGTALSRAGWKPEYANSDPNIQSWYKDQHNSEGQWCCDESDGHPYFGDYTINEDGSVTVERDGKPHVLPKHMILSGANPTGHAVWWFTDAGGVHRDYCFAPGSLT